MSEYPSADFVDKYFEKHVDEALAQIIKPNDKATFLSHELTNWEEIEFGLAEWARNGCKTPNPFQPPFDTLTVAKIIAGLSARLAPVERTLRAKTVH
jgi:hypothetical protein